MKSWLQPLQCRRDRVASPRKAMSLRQHDTRLSRLAAQHEQFLTQAQACIAKDVAAAECDPYKAFLSGLARHLDAHKQWLGTPDRSARTVVQWGPVTATRESGQDGKPALHIHGPTPGDEHICAVANDETAQKMVLLLSAKRRCRRRGGMLTM